MRRLFRILALLCLGTAALAFASVASAGPEEAVGGWVPGAILAWAAIGLGTIVIALLLVIWRAQAKALDSLATKLEDIDKRLTALERQWMGTASLDMLGRMGDRMDGRITNLAADVAVLKDRYDRSKQ